MTIMRFEWAGRLLSADVSMPVSIAIPLDFGGPQAACFDAPPATSRPLHAGLGCNCDVLTLAPHCNGTHTECVGHLTEDRVAVSDCVRGEMVLALLVTVEPVAAAATPEDSDPLPAPGDLLVTAAALDTAFRLHETAAPRAMILRTTRESSRRPHHHYRGPAPAPYLSRQAAAWLVDRGIDHVVLDLPSADRAEDGGRLTAHRTFFGLPAGSRRAGDAKRPQASITELAWIAAAIPDGHYLLDLQIPAFLSDAAPSRPLLYAVDFA
ncbi:MAG: cyclase family protein [Pseudomonadota bacterium]|nr:cyclase family protein [Pseudomonadota bacterium]